jgi:hypothetical protein
MRVLVWGKEKDWSFWKWLFWGLIVYSVLEACTFFIAWLALKRTVPELWGPYVAFVLPGAITLSLVWWLNSWRERGAPPKSLARGWGLSMALLGLTSVGALGYSEVKLHLVKPADAMVSFIIAALMAVVIGYFVGYRMALDRISARRH